MCVLLFWISWVKHNRFPNEGSELIPNLGRWLSIISFLHPTAWPIALAAPAHRELHQRMSMLFHNSDEVDRFPSMRMQNINLIKTFVSFLSSCISEIWGRMFNFWYYFWPICSLLFWNLFSARAFLFFDLDNAPLVGYLWLFYRLALHACLSLCQPHPCFVLTSALAALRPAPIILRGSSMSPLQNLSPDQARQ